MEEMNNIQNRESHETIGRLVPVFTLFVSLATLIVLIKYANPMVSFSESGAVGSVVDGGGIIAPTDIILAVQAVVSNPAVKICFYLLVNLGQTGETRHIVFTNKSQEVVILSGSSIAAFDKTSSANRRGDYDVCCRGSEAGACGWRSSGYCHEVCGASACGGVSIVSDDGYNLDSPYTFYVLDAGRPDVLYTVIVSGADVKVTTSSNVVGSVVDGGIIAEGMDWDLNSSLIDKALGQYLLLNEKDSKLIDIENLKIDIQTYLSKAVN